jgi:hypothetical protein
MPGWDRPAGPRRALLVEEKGLREEGWVRSGICEKNERRKDKQGTQAPADGFLADEVQLR